MGWQQTSCCLLIYLYFGTINIYFYISSKETILLHKINIIIEGYSTIILYKHVFFLLQEVTEDRGRDEQQQRRHDLVRPVDRGLVRVGSGSGPGPVRSAQR